MSVTYYVALPAILPSGRAIIMRTGDPSLGNFADATIMKKFGDVPDNLDEL